MDIKLKEVRIRQKLTINALSTKSGVSKAHISYIENGIRIPTLDILCRLAKALGVEPGELFKCTKEVAKMYKNYETGSNNWTEIGNLSSKERAALITAMEKDIVKNRKTYPDEYFYWLTISYEEAKSDAETFQGYKKSSCYIERLEWLRQKNLALEHSQKLNEILDQLDGKIPADQLNELRDTYEDLTGLLNMY